MGNSPRAYKVVRHDSATEDTQEEKWLTAWSQRSELCSFNSCVSWVSEHFRIYELEYDGSTLVGWW